MSALAFPSPSLALRPYQAEAVDSLLAYFEEKSGNPILALPTGAGKSVIQAAFIRRVLEQWPGERFLLVSHVKELLTQNAQKIQAMVPRASVGLYSAGLGRREAGRQVTIAGIQSVYKLAHRMGDVSICIVDECHLVSKSGETMYEKFFGELRRFCPHVKIVGMSATPYRLDSGPLILGDARIFTDIAYSVSIKTLIDDGFLAPLASAPTRTRADTAGVTVRGGEFVAGELERAVNREDVTGPALDEVERLCGDRKSWLLFCVGVEHAKAVEASLAARGHRCAVVVGETPKAERERSLAAFKRGELRALVSVGVLTTGFDAPNADALICLRPTKSPGLWVQMVGRVSRLSPGKPNGLVLDFTGNTKTHGPVDLIDVDGDGNPRTSPLVECQACGADTPSRLVDCVNCGHVRCKACPQCKGLVPVGHNECAACGHMWERAKRKVEHETTASTASIVSVPSEVLTEVVASWSFGRHRKPEKPDSVCVTYEIDRLTTHREWLCFDHGGYAAQKAATWWVRRCGKSPAPASTAEALSRTDELAMPPEIRVRREGKFWRVT